MKFLMEFLLMLIGRRWILNSSIHDHQPLVAANPSIKRIVSPCGKRMCLGRKRPIVRYPMLKLKHYLSHIIPPESVDYTERAKPALSKMYQNDTLGDCVVVAIEHTVGVLTGNANNDPLIFEDKDTVAFYSAACGYDPNKPSTDGGCDLQTCITYWQNHGTPEGSNHRIAGFLSVDPSNVHECKAALWLFGNLIMGAEMPDEWITPIPQPGFVWDAAGDPDNSNGHCFASFGYNKDTFTISTWGMLGHITPRAMKKYLAPSVSGELYTVISEDWLNTASHLAPNSLDWQTLVADFKALGGVVS